MSGGRKRNLGLPRSDEWGRWRIYLHTIDLEGRLVIRITPRLICHYETAEAYRQRTHYRTAGCRHSEIVQEVFWEENASQRANDVIP